MTNQDNGRDVAPFAPAPKLTPWQVYYAEQSHEWPFDLIGHSNGEWQEEPKDYVFLARAVRRIGALLFTDFQTEGVISPARFEDVIGEMRRAAAQGRLTLVYLLGRSVKPIAPYRWQPDDREPHRWKKYFASCKIEHEALGMASLHDRYPIFVEKQSLEAFLASPSGEVAPPDRAHKHTMDLKAETASQRSDLQVIKDEVVRRLNVSPSYVPKQEEVFHTATLIRTKRGQEKLSNNDLQAIWAMIAGTGDARKGRANPALKGQHPSSSKKKR
jgi:hypothetical protein